MREELLICPSTDPVDKNNANFETNLILYAQQISDAGADFIHCDVMDGVFVERKTINAGDVKIIKENTTLPLDCHLMTAFSKKEVEDFIDAGANIITLHIENFIKNNKLQKCKIKNVFKLIHKNRRFCGITLKPETNISFVKQVLKYVDLVLVMSVKPGKSGQTFIESSYARIEELDNLRKNLGLDFLLEVDGGITPEIAKKLQKLNVDMIVSGNYIYTAKNRKEMINKFKFPN